ncbi:unnamed protein product [Paramecium sonneborni]|uniref:EGF-like domain-containing protein n=1 Tax=Paramecium sonneborni TaxID=65129 RepID=A0A8S1LVJ0_9CILI|nr:unnamed protein product [Paramecium sonneborni]
MQFFQLIFQINIITSLVLGDWIIQYNAMHEFKTIKCDSIGCLYGFKNQENTGPALYLNCLTTPLTALKLDNNQMSSIQNLKSLTPSESNAYKLIMFDVYYTSQWVNDVIDFEFNNQIFQIRHSTQNPLPSNIGFCDSVEYEIRTYNFTLSYSSIYYQFPKFQIQNPSVSAMIRNVHFSYQNCYPGCTFCTGPYKNQCTGCYGTLTVVNNECRCPIRTSMIQGVGCVNKCYIRGAKLKSQNRICETFSPTTLHTSNFQGIELSAWYNWNVIYDPLHLDMIDKKLSPYNFGLFRFREGAFMSFNTIFAVHPLVILVQLVFCNSTPINSGVQFYINQTYIGSFYFDGTKYIYDKIEFRYQQVHPVTGECINNQLISAEIFTTVFEQQLTFSIQGNFTTSGAGWFLRLLQFSSGYCPNVCLKCDKFYRCIQCPSGSQYVSDGTCKYWGCPFESTYNGTHCVKQDEVTKYSKYFLREFYDFTVTDTLNKTFILETYMGTDLQKGSYVFWSYTDTQRIFGGKFVWAQSRFSQIYTLDPHHSLTIYFQVIFGPNFPNSINNYLSYEINNGTINKITKTSSLNIVEQILTYNPTLTIAIQCYGINVLDSYCGISNYSIVVHYCKPYCYRCSNELTCDQWMPYDPNIIKVEQSQCQSNQFLDETTSTCEYCPNECLTCFNEYECLTCKSNYKLVITTCILDCQLNQYYDGVNCLDCNYSCRQCQSINYCIHCESTSLRYLYDGQCLCYDGYYDQINIQQCQPCDKLCTKCNGPTNKNCQSCIILNNLIKTGNTCECSIGYYFDEFKLKCLKCSDKCETCFNFSNTSCLSCYSIQFRIIDGLNCKCQNGYYDDNSDICIQCPFLEDSLLQYCYKICGDNSIIWFNSNCSSVTCGNGYNNVNNQCLPICGDLIIVAEEDCDDGNSIQFDGCHNCRFQCPAQCTTCNSTTQFPCSDVCGDGIVSGLEECDDSHPIQLDLCYQCKFQCQPQCTRCIKGICSECQTFGWMFDVNSSFCVEKCGDKFVVGNEPCDDGYNFDSNDSCLNCQRVCREDCKTCSNDGTTCLECKTIGFAPYLYHCINICGDGYLAIDPYNRYFEQCDDFNRTNYDGCNSNCQFQCQPKEICTTCINNKCQSCVSTYYLDTSKNKCIEICYDNIIVGNEKCEDMNSLMLDGCYNCQLSCQQSCQTCTINGCTKCKIGYKLINRYCRNICGDSIVVDGEDCDDGNLYPFDSCHQCVYQCSSNCQICLNGQCLQCKKDYIKIKGFCQKSQDSFQLKMLQEVQQFQIQMVFFEFCLIFDNINCLKCVSLFTYNSIAQKCEEQSIYHDRYFNQDYIQPLLEFCLIQYQNQCLKCIDNFYLDEVINKCEPICGDYLINGNEECEDNNSLLFDGCFNCKFLCHYSCNKCHFGKCQECQEQLILKEEKFCEPKAICNEIGYYLNEKSNTCIENCGDSIVTQNEDCDDGNNIQYDGCYQCKFQCQKYCSDCIEGKCQITSSICQYGQYFNFSSLSCESLCGDGILIEPYEQCDDGNQIEDDECNNNCQLQCDSKCDLCNEFNQCQICKENYEMINNKCEENQNFNQQIKNCAIISDIECLQCDDGYTLQNNNCIIYCGDGLINGEEICDDENNINGDGCDTTCTPSQNSYCKDSQCTIVIFPIVKLHFQQELFGLQYVQLVYNQDMRLAQNYSKQDYLNDLQFQIQNFNDAAIITLQTDSVTQYLKHVIIQIKIQFLNYVKDPILELKFNNKLSFINEYGLPIQQDALTLKLLSPNVLNQSQQQNAQSLINMSSQLLTIMAIFIGFSSLTGQLSIISNLLDLIQQLYYLKYLNSRIGINLAQYYQTFKIIQLTNIYDHFNINPNSNFQNILAYYESEPIFEFDDRNANFLNNILLLSLIYVVFGFGFKTLNLFTQYMMKKLSQLKSNNLNWTQLQIVIFIQNVCLKIKKQKLMSQLRTLFLTLIYEFGINVFLAIKYSKRDSQGLFGFTMAILCLLISLLALLSQLRQIKRIIRRLGTIQKEMNVFVYICSQKLLFAMFLVFFYQSGLIQIMLSILNEFQYCYILYSQKMIKQPSENLKQLSSHIIQFIILSIYLINHFYQNDPQNLILIGWSIISLMSLILMITVIIDLFDLTYPFVRKINKKCSTQQSQVNEIFCVVENQVIAGNRQLLKM